MASEYLGEKNIPGRETVNTESSRGNELVQGRMRRQVHLELSS